VRARCAVCEHVPLCVERERERERERGRERERKQKREGGRQKLFRGRLDVCECRVVAVVAVVAVVFTTYIYIYRTCVRVD
jgi:hypothetical protein